MLEIKGKAEIDLKKLDEAGHYVPLGMNVWQGGQEHINLQKQSALWGAGKEDVMAFPTIDMIKTGQNINRLRKLAGVSVKDLQEVFGFATPQAIYKWQHGTTLPTIDNLVVLAAVLGVRMDEILVMTDTQVSLSA